jgi:hypothetical protein
LAAGAGLEWKLNRNAGFFLEADYSSRQVRRLSGSGWMQSDDGYNRWKGEWWIRKYWRERAWGILHQEYPSNYWPDELLSERVRPFNLDLSGAEARIGLYFRF